MLHKDCGIARFTDMRGEFTVPLSKLSNASSTFTFLLYFLRFPSGFIVSKWNCLVFLRLWWWYWWLTLFVVSFTTWMMIVLSLPSVVLLILRWFDYSTIDVPFIDYLLCTKWKVFEYFSHQDTCRCGFLVDDIHFILIVYWCCSQKVLVLKILYWCSPIGPFWLVCLPSLICS